MSRLVLRTRGTDSNPAGASAFVGIPRPVGVSDGDLLVVAVALPAAALTVTPPDVDWTLIEQTDPVQPIGLAVFWKIALCEPVNWVFALSSSVRAIGTVLVYGSADAFGPIEVSAAKLTAASFNHGVGALSASEGDEELALFLSAAGVGTYTPASPFLEVATKTQTGVTLSAQRRNQPAAGAMAAFTVPFSLAVASSSLLLVIRPSYGERSIEDVFRTLVRGFPGGVDRVYDLEPGGDYYKLFRAQAQTFKVFASDLYDLLRREILPSLCRYKLPDWERIFGLQTGRAARSGVIPQRQAQVVAAWRFAAGQGSSIPEVRGVVGPIFGYLPATVPEVIESDPNAMRLRHSYDFGPVDLALPIGVTTTLFRVNDGGKVSSAGARLYLVFDDPDVSTYTIRLTNPAGNFKEWSPVGVKVGPVYLYAKELAGKGITGIWTLTITNAGAGANTLFAGPTLQVDGFAKGQETGGAIYEWGVYADPAHLAEIGVSADLAAALDKIERMAFSHSTGRLILSKAAWPDTATGLHASIPDRFIPI